MLATRLLPTHISVRCFLRMRAGGARLHPRLVPPPPSHRRRLFLAGGSLGQPHRTDRLRVPLWQVARMVADMAVLSPLLRSIGIRCNATQVLFPAFSAPVVLLHCSGAIAHCQGRGSMRELLYFKAVKECSSGGCSTTARPVPHTPAAAATTSGGNGAAATVANLVFQHADKGKVGGGAVGWTTVTSRQPAAAAIRRTRGSNICAAAAARGLRQRGAGSGNVGRQNIESSRRCTSASRGSRRAGGSGRPAARAGENALVNALGPPAAAPAAGAQGPPAVQGSPGAA